MPWNPKSAKGNNISFSEINALTQCEEKWNLQYRHHEDRAPSQKMVLGTSLHAGIEAWWSDPAITDHNVRAAMIEAELDEFREHGIQINDEHEGIAIWLIERYVQHYAELRKTVTFTKHELELTAQLPGTKTTVMGHLDGIYTTDDGDYLVERKSYGRRDRLEILHVDPQITLYAWLARENGYDIKGVAFDGIYTYQWKKPRNVADSFDWIWLDRTPAQIEEALVWAKAAVSRRHSLRRGAIPLRNVSYNCTWCPAQERCFEKLAFPPIQVVAE